MSINFIILYIKEFLKFCLFSNFKFHISTIYYWKLNFFLKCVTSFRGGGSEKCGTSFRGGGQRNVWRHLGGVRDLWQFVTGGGGSKIAKNSVTSFMDGP